jgi:hypothetical protein
MSNFRPTTPLQPDHTLPPPSSSIPAAPAPTDCIPAVYTPAAPVLVNPAPVVNPTTDPPIGPTPIVEEPVARAPRDLSGLRSGVRNPWSNLSRRRSYIHPPRDLSGLKSGTRNPWGSINHRRRRFHPPREHHSFSSPEQLLPRPNLHPSTHPQQGKPALRKSPSRPNSYSHSRPPESPQLEPHAQPQLPAQFQPTAHIFQIIRHPHGISPTKSKITKIFPIPTTKTTKNPLTPCCACGNLIPANRPDRGSWRSKDFGWRFGRRVRTRFHSRFPDW